MSRYVLERMSLMIVGSFLMYFVCVLLLEKAACIDDTTDMGSCMHMESSIAKQKGCKLNLSQHEKKLLSCVVPRESITVRFEDVIGLDETKETLLNTVVHPLTNKTAAHECKLLSPPNGIILYGPPGTGKTMLAKAVCNALDCAFLSVSIDTVENKMYGESSKIVSALMSLAQKIAPCVVFFDEMDGFFSVRNSIDQSFVNNLKTQMLTKMDGLTSQYQENRVVFMGTTNRLDQVDPAIKRRMRTHIFVPLPDQETRARMLELHVGAYEDKQGIDYLKVAEVCEGLSGSDIDELCKHAAHQSVKKHSGKQLSISEELMVNSAKYFVQ